MTDKPTRLDPLTEVWKSRAQSLQLKVEELEVALEEYREKEKLASSFKADVTCRYQACFGLTRTEALVLFYLLKNSPVTIENMFDFMYGSRPDGGPSINVLKVFIWKLRQKLRMFDVAVETIWGGGYRLPADSQSRLHEMLNNFDLQAEDPRP